MSSLRLGTVVLMVSFSIIARADLLGDARQYIDHKQPARAYELLAAHLGEYAGNADFDYLLGITALDSGHPSEAIFALERILDSQPDHALARAELARAYYLLGEDAVAREEFESLREQQLPAGMQETIDHYLSAIDQRRPGQAYDLNPYVSMGLGYDSNVNSATDASQIALPALGNLLATLDSTGRKQRSGIMDLGAGIRFASAIHEGLDFFGSIDFDERLALHQSEFSTRTADGAIGLHWQRGEEQYRLTAQGQRYFVNGNTNRNLAGMQAQWQHRINQSNQVSLFGQFSIQRYPDQSVRDVNSYTGGGAWVHAFTGKHAALLFCSLFLGTDDELSDSRQDQGRDFGGLRIGGRYNVSARIQAYASMNYQHSRYGAADPIFLKRRRDNFASLSLGARYAIGQHWSLRPELSYTHNDSTLPVNGYERMEAMLTLRNDF